MHRCQLLAEGIVRAHEQGGGSLEQRLSTVVSCFAESGISLERPFLNPGSEDIYETLAAAA
jgi:hypothetical protein